MESKDAKLIDSFLNKSIQDKDSNEPPKKKECTDDVENTNVEDLLLQQKELMNGNISNSSNEVKDDEDSDEPIDNEAFDEDSDYIEEEYDDNAKNLGHDVILEKSKYVNPDEVVEFDERTTGLVNHLRECLGLVTFKKKTFDDYQVPFKVGSILTGPNLKSRLKEWFPFESDRFLQNVSESHAVNNNDESALADFFCRVLDKDESILYSDKNTSSPISQFPFIRCRLFPPNKVSTMFDLEFDNLFRLANDEYRGRYEMGIKGGMNYMSHMKNTSGKVPDLECVDYIFNPEIAKQFEETRRDFQIRGIPVKERRIFHGTHHDSIMPIISGNFDIDAKRVDGGKAMAYGRGIYFSDFPTFSLGYGKSLLMCRVLTGIESTQRGNYGNYTNPGAQSQNSLPNYNTFRNGMGMMGQGTSQAKDGNDLSSIYVVTETRQILPCYIIHMKDTDSKDNKKDINRVKQMKWKSDK